MEAVKEKTEVAKVAEKVGIMFKRVLLAAYALVPSPGKYKLTVANNVDDRNLYTDDEGRKRYIVNFKGIAPDQLEEVKKLFKDREEVDIEETNGLFLSASVWVGKSDDVQLPMKGEQVEVMADFVPNKEKTKQLLRLVSMRIGKAKEAIKLDLGDLFGEAEEPAFQNKPEPGELQHS